MAQETTENDPGRRHDGTTTRRQELGLRVQSPLSDDEEKVVTRVMDCCFAVHRELGPGFKERIYKEALRLELDARGVRFECEKPIQVRYKEWRIPGQRIDMLIEDVLVVEIKAAPKILELHRTQVRSYLRTLALPLGVLVNFNVELMKHGFKRVVR